MSTELPRAPLDKKTAIKKLQEAEVDFLRAHGWETYLVEGMPEPWWVQPEEGRPTDAVPFYKALILAKAWAGVP